MENHNLNKEEEIFLKKYWPEEDITFYLHFIGDMAVEQIEVTPGKKVLLSLDSPIGENNELYDQSLTELELDGNEYITKEEFYEVWNDIK